MLGLNEPRPGSVFGMVGWVETPAEITKVCETLRDAGYKDFDAHTPFPVHGLENAMGAPPSKLPWIVLACAMTGFASALVMMIWMTVYDYPLVIGGKPYLTIPSYVPITFELTILFSALGTFFGMWGLNLLPRLHHPTFHHPSFHRFSDDRFFISVEAIDDKYDGKKTRDMLESAGVKDVQEVAP